MEELGQAAPPNFMIMLDRSGSMEDPIEGRRKWDIAKDSLGAVLPEFDGLVRAGLMLFPGPLAGCEPGRIDVDVADENAQAVLDAIPADPLHTTPIGASLEVLRDYEGLDDLGRGNFILLITDGFESCNGDPVAAAGDLAADSPPVRAHVVGFGDLVDAAELTRIAEAAGTARDGDVAYWRAGNRSELSDAISQVASAVTSCGWTLDGIPPVPDEMFVYFDETPVERDREDGWDYDPESNAITFFGDSCRGVQDGRHRVRVVFGCP
jgi:hypothetical protein